MITYIGIALVALINFALVGVAGVFAITGEGRADGMYWVWGIGGCWVTAFALRAFFLAARGEKARARHVVISTLLYALLILVCFNIFLSIAVIVTGKR